jgi:hypothetical protein
VERERLDHALFAFLVHLLSRDYLWKIAVIVLAAPCAALDFTLKYASADKPSIQIPNCPVDAVICHADPSGL